ncbi:MAG: hypothetical protein K8S27_15805 [Candidatus Omnitrophica bacterium]|nr:hypothetical protein [Candidatus Omnitrophota bacterium]
MMGDFLISMIKIMFFVVLLPVIFATVSTFQNHLANYPDLDLETFLSGAYVLLMIFLFFYQFWGVYEFGKNVMNNLFKFLAPFDKLFLHILSFYVLVTMAIFYVTNNLLNVSDYNFLFMFLLGFFMSLHILLVAQDMQDDEKSLIKPNYLFHLPVIIIGNVFILVLFFDLLMERWTFVDYFKTLSLETQETFMISLKSIFSIEGS